MTPARGRALTTAATAVTLGGIAFGVAEAETASALACAAGLVAVTVGWVVVRAQPDSPVGPALAWSSASVAAALAVEIVAKSAYTSHPLPLAGLARPIWVGIWPLHLAGLFTLLLLFPEGRIGGRRWRGLIALYAAGTLAMVVSSWDAREVAGSAVGGPTGAWTTMLGALGVAAIGSCLIVAVVRVVLRYRSGDERRREQIRWLLLAASVTVALLMLGWLASALGAPLGASYAPFIISGVVLVPLAIGIAMVRHDLFDIDRLLSESASWALTVLCSAAAFGAVVLVAGQVVGAGTPLSSAAAAFLIALVFLPLQRHVAAAVGRVVDRDRFVARAEVEAFAAEVRHGRRQPEEIEAVLRKAQRDPALRLLLARPDGSWVELSGRSFEKASGIAVQSGGDTIARIQLGRESARSRRRIAELARAGWVPIEVSRLRLALHDALTEVQASRTRLVEATADERKRLERDLHDGVQQRIVATGMRLRSLQNRGLDAAQSGEVDDAVAELESTIRELRRLAHGVRPSRLDDGLGAALASVRADCPIPLDLTVDDLPQLDDARALAAYFVVSEAVANALKHSQAQGIRVRVGEAGGRLAVEVHDDGGGGVPPLGLTGLRDRVRSLGGQLDVDSAPATGTTIRAVL